MQVFHGKGASFIEFEQQVRLWMQMTEMEPPKRAAALVVHMNSTARQVCLAVAGDHIAKNNGAEHVVNTLRDYFAPATADSISLDGPNY